MRGDRQVSLKNLARSNRRETSGTLQTSRGRATYRILVGGPSPFGLRKHLPINVDRSILSLDKIYINGGHRGCLVSISPQVLTNLLQAHPVRSATTDEWPRCIRTFLLLHSRKSLVWSFPAQILLGVNREPKTSTHIGELFRACRACLRHSFFGKSNDERRRGSAVLGLFAQQSRSHLQTLRKLL